MSTTSKTVRGLADALLSKTDQHLDRRGTFSLDVPPVPASRPRVTRWGTYYGKNYERFRKEALPLAEAFPGIPTDRPIFVYLEVIVARPKTTKRTYPRGDVDNYAKAPLDSFQEAGKFYNDDDQVVGLLVFKRYAKPGEKPRVYAEWFEIEEDE